MSITINRASEWVSLFHNHKKNNIVLFVVYNYNIITILLPGI